MGRGQEALGITYNEFAALIEEILLQGSLKLKSENERTRAVATNLIFRHCVADVFGHATQPIHILGIFQESSDPVSLCHWDEVLKNGVKFTINKRASDR
jgi:hypothetical protein